MDNPRALQVLYIDDDEVILEQTEAIFEGKTTSILNQEFLLELVTNSNFESALPLLQKGRFDLLILDVRLGSYELFQEEDEEAGRKTYELIKQNYFVPIIFYTAIPERVRFLESSLVRVVKKSQRTEGLLKAISEILETRIPDINHSLMMLFEEVKRDYMWRFVESHWEDFASSQDSDLAYLLARRIAASLSEDSLNQLFSNNVDKVHPLRYYVMPPVSVSIMAGDLYEETDSGKKRYFIILTPSCDLYEGQGRTHKVEEVLLARCSLLTDTPEHVEWTQKPNNGTKKSLERLLLNSKSERFYYLPRAIRVPDLVIDFQALKLASFDKLKERDNYVRIASLDSPFVEAVLNRFSHYIGRLGTPDLDVNINFPDL